MQSIVFPTKVKIECVQLALPFPARNKVGFLTQPSVEWTCLLLVCLNGPLLTHLKHWFLTEIK